MSLNFGSQSRLNLNAILKFKEAPGIDDKAIVAP